MSTVWVKAHISNFKFYSDIPMQAFLGMHASAKLKQETARALFSVSKALHFSKALIIRYAERFQAV